MTTTTGSVTIMGSSGVNASFTVTNDAFGLSLASSFQSMVATLETAPGGFYAYPATGPGSAFLALDGDPNNLGEVGVAGPQGSSTLLGGDGTSFVYTGPITGSAAALIVGGSGNDTVLSGIGNDTMALGTGNNGYLVGVNGVVDSQGTDTIVGGVGTTDVSVSGSNSVVATSDISGSQLNLDDSMGTGTTVYVYNNASIIGASGSVTTINAAGPATVTAGMGGINYMQSGGTLLLNAQAGETDTISAASGGPDTVYGASGSTVLYSGSTGNNVFVANDPTHGEGGSVDFNAGTTTVGNQFWAGSGNATLIGGTGVDTIVAGNGMSTLTGGSGSANYFDLFSVNGGSGTNVTITDFNAASGNSITLFNYGASGAAYAIDNQAQQPNGTGTLITLSDKSTILLQGVTTNLNSSQIKYT